MKIGEIIGGKRRIAIRESVPQREREKSRKRKRGKRKAGPQRSYRGCGWNHKVPGYPPVTEGFKKRGSHKRAWGKWEEPEEWVVDREVPAIVIRGEIVVNGSSCTNVGAPIANECAGIPPLKRPKGRFISGRMSYNVAVQHGIVVEK